LNSNKKEKHPFKISKKNIIYVLITVFKIRTIEFDPESFGYLIGTIIGYFLFPTIIALFFWWILERKKNDGNLAFTIFFTIIIFGQFSEFTKRTSEKNQPLKDIQKSRNQI